MSNEPPDNLVQLRPTRPRDRHAGIDLDALRDLGPTGVLVQIETLHQRINVLEHALAGFTAFATEEQRFAVRRMVEKSIATYDPAATTLPEHETLGRSIKAAVVKLYIGMFSA